ncbi:TetR/AcrR family transcriptional regulator [Aquimarina sp. MMG015]|uniref:TetR/AcrR family transcriptional regulator n=1 Tax=Aquimarina sp. MMG015 TaxID=2822689 RepID=UPI001B39D7DB|nr:TetR/AcrR family transcriptional regulator [Aquimarina sp. MMG015]MBQ4801936.1 TetR/AcrR family transcriptional regulator [Aquimarina sp. MMG015]
MPKTKTSKAEVLSKVIPILREKGICKSSMSELAKACEIQKSHFYYYFNSKEQLIKEVLATVNSYFKHTLFKVIESNSLTIDQKLQKIHGLINKMFKNDHSGCIMANTALETAHLNPIYKDEIKHFFEDFIAGLQLLLAPNYPKEETLSLAEQMVQDLEGGILLMRIYNDHKYVNNAVSRMEKIILKS